MGVIIQAGGYYAEFSEGRPVTPPLTVERLHLHFRKIYGSVVASRLRPRIMRADARGTSSHTVTLEQTLRANTAGPREARVEPRLILEWLSGGGSQKLTDWLAARGAAMPAPPAPPQSPAQASEASSGAAPGTSGPGWGRARLERRRIASLARLKQLCPDPNCSVWLASSCSVYEARVQEINEELGLVSLEVLERGDTRNKWFRHAVSAQHLGLTGKPPVESLWALRSQAEEYVSSRG